MWILGDGRRFSARDGDSIDAGLVAHVRYVMRDTDLHWRGDPLETLFGSLVVLTKLGFVRFLQARLGPDPPAGRRLLQRLVVPFVLVGVDLGELDDGPSKTLLFPR